MNTVHDSIVDKLHVSGGFASKIKYDMGSFHEKLLEARETIAHLQSMQAELLPVYERFMSHHPLYVYVSSWVQWLCKERTALPQHATSPEATASPHME